MAYLSEPPNVIFFLQLRGPVGHRHRHRAQGEGGRPPRRKRCTGRNCAGIAFSLYVKKREEGRAEIRELDGDLSIHKTF